MNQEDVGTNITGLLAALFLSAIGQRGALTSRRTPDKRPAPGGDETQGVTYECNSMVPLW
jgi:hypothetical protein